MRYNPKIHNRKSIRLKGYDYSQEGLYFVTICCQNREHFFGEIIGGIMLLNDAGVMIEKWYFELENKFPDIKCGAMVVMPNHFHCVIQNLGYNKNSVGDDSVGDDSVGDDSVGDDSVGDDSVGDDLCVIPNKIPSPILPTDPLLGEHVGSPLHRVVQWFKTMSTNEYIRGVKSENWKRFDGKLWQRNYYEHIIRNERSHRNISKYIENNPAKWEADKLRK